MGDLQDKLEDFKVLPILLNDDDVNEGAFHSIFIRRYRSEKSSPEKPVGKTLQVFNIPPYVTKKALIKLFGEEDVDRVLLTDSQKNEHKNLYQVHSDFFSETPAHKFLIGYVIFKKTSSLDAFLRLQSLPPLEKIPTGVEKWTNEYNKSNSVDVKAMQDEINLYMQHYDKVKAAKDQAHEDEADGDGWVTVGKKGNVQGFSQHENVISKLEKKIQVQKKNQKNMKNFYAFELREGKKRHLMDLRRKFEEDKAKLNSMKQNRKFKPY